MNNTETATFTNCVMQCWDNPDFMREYRRLTGSTLGADSRAAIEKMIDAETGHIPALDAAEVRAFIDFVREYVWGTFVAKMSAEVGS